MPRPSTGACCELISMMRLGSCDAQALALAVNGRRGWDHAASVSSMGCPALFCACFCEGKVQQSQQAAFVGPSCGVAPGTAVCWPCHCAHHTPLLLHTPLPRPPQTPPPPTGPPHPHPQQPPAPTSPCPLPASRTRLSACSWAAMRSSGRASRWAWAPPSRLPTSSA